jgi:signal transduction histidine kinase
MASASLDYSIQPYSGTDLVALVLAIAALHCLTIRRRDQEPGMGWIAAGMAAMAGWVGANRLHLPSGPELNPSPWYYLMCGGMACITIGLVDYLAVPPRRRRWTLTLAIAPAAAFSVLVAWVGLTGAIVPRAWVHGLTAIVYITLAATAVQAARREPGAGHAWVGATLLLVPGLVLVLAATGADPVALRYWAVLPVMLVGLTLPTVSVMRRQRALRAEVARRAAAEQALNHLNATLESKVNERTADLHSMVAGLESFNRSVSHDLQGPLGGIAGLARLAAQTLEQGDVAMAQRALPAIAQQAETSASLVVSLLELASVGEANLALQPVDPAAMACEVIDQFKLQPGGASLPRFVLKALPMVEADPSLLRAVLTNLIGNAVKFTRERADGQVEIAAEALNGQVCLQVRDNGVGFDAAASTALFAPFHRQHGAGYDGHGIGLSIVRRAVERHGGTVWAESRPGQGACFSFTLPAAG